ncbi:hypothetical protein BU26DRAFT_89082 [Trematosphaeria pertusa]|uniref:Zn(2)-C6 fungal-type domain-containing protein n=1 Tax=Trematosphaeria pertusa TaxID=390896 RepID=A0A6A6I3R1_9PLEO|nr:uncharacterized protein BU26DRAFT_89082 [Trematosphaeria pertusa]KAF2244906.1 hypothetical protein BU26DRAFT_89082 [Trematosphaeria pertusa]
MDSRLKCHICKKIFTQKSSLVRHSKRCTPGPAPSLRQKSCRQCTSSKTKCDLRRPKCSRCELRDTPCEYVVPMTRGVPVHAPDEETDRVEPNEREHDSTNLALVANIASIGLPRVPPSLIRYACSPCYPGLYLRPPAP